MPKNPKRPRDPNELAKLIVDIAAGEIQDAQDSDNGPMSTLGKAGGLRGGRARADKLSSEQREDIARRAAAARWPEPLNNAIRHYHGLFIDYMQKRGIKGAMHCRRWIRRIA